MSQLLMIYKHETKKSAEPNLPRGRELQGKTKLGMPSLLLLIQNEELATTSRRSNLYTKSFIVITKFYVKYRIPDKHDTDSSHLDIIITINYKGVAKHGVQDPFTNALSYFDVTDNCNRYPLQHLL